MFNKLYSFTTDELIAELLHRTIFNRHYNYETMLDKEKIIKDKSNKQYTLKIKSLGE